MNSVLRNEVNGGGVERGGLVREYEERIKKLEVGERDRQVWSSECVKLEGKLKDMESYYIKNESKRRLEGVGKKDGSCQTEGEGFSSS